MGYLYKHIRLDTNEVFYIGIGGFSKSEKLGTYRRAYTKYERSSFWNRVVNITEYIVEIILENLSWEEACEKEKEYIKLYGRKNNGTGILVNLTDGGDGSVGVVVSEETKRKKSIANIGKKRSEETKRKISEKLKGNKNGFRENKQGRKKKVRIKTERKKREIVECPKCGKIVDVCNASRWHFDKCGKSVSDEYRKKVKESKRNITIKRTLIQIDGMIYHSFADAARKLGLSWRQVEWRCKSDKYQNFIFIKEEDYSMLSCK